jgi:predicted kinase
MIHINPDDELGSPRHWTPERNTAAWEKCFSRLRAALQSSPQPAEVFVVCGVQGAGKTHWIRANSERLGPKAVVFDAALPGARHRAPIIEIASEYHAVVKAVWINVPLESAKRQNRNRAIDEVVPDDVIEAIYRQFEPPEKAEGFRCVVEIRER